MRKRRRHGRPSSWTRPGTANGGDYVEPDKPVEPGKDKRIAVNEYAIAVSPSDGAVWGTVIGYPGAIVRTVLGANPIETALSEIYEPTLPGYGPRGGDIDADGVYWGGARQRARRQFRPAQMQGAERSDRDRATLPGRLDAVSITRPANARCERRVIMSGSTGSTRSVSGRTCRSSWAILTVRSSRWSTAS